MHENQKIWFEGPGHMHLKEESIVPVRYQTNDPTDAKVDTFYGLWADVAVYGGEPMLILICIFLHPGIFPPKSKILYNTEKALSNSGQMTFYNNSYMKSNNQVFKIITFLISILLMSVSVFPCSMFKITMYGKTMVGNNEDAWRLDSKIWFEPGKDGKYGSAYVGHNDMFPQGGMNEMGLVYAGDVKIPRYIRGNLFLQNNIPDTSLAFCLSVMDTMHECRSKIGDGTTYTSIYDLKEGIIYLYFYHDFKHVVKFNLHQELGKGDHIIRMLDIFPPNREYIRFTEYKTPFNSLFLRLIFYALIAFYIVTAIMYMSILIRNRIFSVVKTGHKWNKISVWVHLYINTFLAYYLYILLTNLPVYYFDSPYKFDNNHLLNALSYFPILLIVAIIPIICSNIRIARQAVGVKYIRSLLPINSITYIFVLALFGYWGFFKVF